MDNARINENDDFSQASAENLSGPGSFEALAEKSFDEIITPSTMKRREMKYIVDSGQVAALKKIVSEHMPEDKYGLTTVASLYYDTPDKRLIRTSVEKPAFKEKIRLRAYGEVTEDSTLYLEIKRKADGVVYKRRVPVSRAEADAFFNYERLVGGDEQISKEITYFRDYYKTLRPSCVILYDRLAFYAERTNLRVTFDMAPRYRTDNLRLCDDMTGTLLLPEGFAVLEIKAQKVIPLWLSGALTRLNIKKESYSKYGEAYARMMLSDNKGE